MIFASTPPINDDPTPWIGSTNGWSGRFGTEDEAQSVEDSQVADVIDMRSLGLVKDPRSEFDRPRAHEANPVLLAFREYVARKDVVPSSVSKYYLFGIATFEVFGGFRDWDRETHPFHSLTTATAEQVEHAKRVLSRALPVKR